MKICHIIVGLHTGGAELMLARLVRNQNFCEHLIVSLTDMGCVGERLSNDGFEVKSLGLNYFNILGVAFKLFIIVKQFNPDVVQTWMYHSDLIGGFVSRLAGIRNVVWNVRGTRIPQRFFSLTSLVVYLCVFFSKSIPRAIICNSEYAIKFHEELGFERSKFVYVPNGFEISPRQRFPRSKDSLKRQFGLPTNVVLIGLVGRFDPLKDIQGFVSAAELLMDENVVFVLVGRGLDPENKGLISILEKSNVGKKFKLIGEIEDVHDLFECLDVHCLASKAEGFPNVVAEAMLAGTPCVVTDVGQARDIVGDTGVVVPSSDPVVLAQGLKEMLSRVDLEGDNLSQECHKRIAQKFDIERIARFYQTVYSTEDLNGFKFRFKDS